MKEIIKHYLPSEIRERAVKAEEQINNSLLEIRLRCGRPLEFVTGWKSYFVTSRGMLLDICNSEQRTEEAFIPERELLERAVLMITENSPYAVRDKLSEGFITLPGGHRVGFSGRVVLEKGEIVTLRDIGGINYRISREVIGCAEQVAGLIYDRDRGVFHNTLIVSPPMAGKTTLLRDLIRLASTGRPEDGIRGHKVGVVDERSEIAGVYRGRPGNDLGPRTDIMVDCPKAEGMIMLIRSMSPEIIAADEIGSEEDVRALKKAVNSGVRVFATVHGAGMDTLLGHPDLCQLVDEKVFSRFLFLSKKEGVGTLECIKNVRGEVICQCR